MKNKPWKNSNTALELTSLLDVIFIILMVVSLNQQKNIAENEQAVGIEIASLEAELEVADAELNEKSQENERLKIEKGNIEAKVEGYIDQLSVYENQEVVIESISIWVTYEEENPKIRHIIASRKGNTEFEETVTSVNSGEKFEKLKSHLSELAESSKGKLVVVTLSTSNILYRDMKAAKKIMDELSAKHSNICLQTEDSN